MKRICVYLIYDRQNIVDGYIGYMLGELKTCADYLAVVCNMPGVICGRDILESYADEIFYRENIGLDAGGFKDALCRFIGWDKVLEYDELVLVNDSLFGPFKPMKDIFAEMDEKPLDFWGLAKHGECDSADIGYLHEHIQSYFFVIRSKMLHCAQFKKYWEEMPYYTAYIDVVKQHEVQFSHHFSNLGYSYDALADTKKNDSINIKNNYSQYYMISFELLKKRNFPFLKKNPLAHDPLANDTLQMQTQQDLRKALDYIDKETDYDVDLIWGNIIRTMNMADLQRNLHLQYIIHPEEKRRAARVSAAIIIFAEHKEAAEYVLEYLDVLKRESDYSVQVIAAKDEVLEAYKHHGAEGRRLLLKRSCDLEKLCRYDLVCVLHDADVTSDVHPSCVGKSYFYCIWENLFKDEGHIAGIAEKFEKEGRLGFLAPPQPNFANYFGELGSGWDGNYKAIEGVIKRLRLNCPISEEKPPFRVTGDFWIRGNILKCLADIGMDEHPHLPYLWSYFAQHMGYYSGIVESMEYAYMNEVNMQHYLKQIASKVRRHGGGFKLFSEMQDIILSDAAHRFCSKYSRILIYGTGGMAEKKRDLLPDFEAYIVSDGQMKPDSLYGKPVMYLSEIAPSDDCGIIVCLNEKNQTQVIPLLEKRGIKHYFCV